MVKMQKKSEGWGDGQGGCEQRIEVIVKMQKEKSEGVRVGWGGVVRVDVNEELTLL